MTQNNAEKSKNKGITRLWSNAYVRNIIYAVLVFTAIVFASKWFLSCITRHDKSAPVPDFKGLHINEAQDLADRHDLRIEIDDSVFTSDAIPGTVLEQLPKKETQVKKNRMIYLTINSITPKKIAVPNVVGYSLRQAKAVLGSKGIYVGKITYRSDRAMNNVIGQVSKDVETGNYVSNEDGKQPTVYFGDEVELILGMGENPDERNTVVPNITGKDIMAAKNLLIESYLNVGAVTYDSSITTSDEKRNAIVKTQSPGAHGRCSLGETVNITLTVKQ